MMRIEHSIVVNRPVDVVFAYVSDLENMPRWGTSVAVTKLSEGPVGVGTRYREEASFRGRKMEFPDEVVAFDPNQTFAVRTSTGMMQSTTTITFTPTSEGTELSYRVEAQPRGPFALLAPLIAPRIKKQFVADVANLKKVLEESPSET